MHLMNSDNNYLYSEYIFRDMTIILKKWLNYDKKRNINQREMRQLAVYYTGPQSFIITFFSFVDLTTLGTLVNFD